MKGNIKSVVKWAMEVADDLPEKYQQTAFAELLRHALRSASDAVQIDNGDHAKAAQISIGKSWQSELQNGIPPDHIIAENGSRTQQAAWAVVTLCAQGKEATSKSVREIIQSHLGVTPETLDNTSKRLKELTPKHVTRAKRVQGRGYSYTPTRLILEIFEGLEE